MVTNQPTLAYYIDRFIAVATVQFRNVHTVTLSAKAHTYKRMWLSAIWSYNFESHVSGVYADSSASEKNICTHVLCAL